MNEYLENICINLEAFEAQVSDLKNQNAALFDKIIGVPAWQENNINYAKELPANIGRFLLHVDMLENANSLIDDVDINKNILKSLTSQLLKLVDLFLKHPENTEDKKIGRELASQLNAVEDILNKFTRTNEPDRPGNR